MTCRAFQSATVPTSLATHDGPPSHLLIRGLSRCVHASMTQLLPMARAWLPRHRGGLRNREQKQVRKSCQKVQEAQKRAWEAEVTGAMG